jgi:ribosomal protein S11
MRYIIHIKTTPNNLIFNVTDYIGNTLFMFSAKSSKYKSKQVRSTIVLETLWEKLINQLKTHNCKFISLKYTGALEYQKKKMIKKLTDNNFIITSIQILTPISFNGCRIRHFRRV